MELLIFLNIKIQYRQIFIFQDMFTNTIAPTTNPDILGSIWSLKQEEETESHVSNSLVTAPPPNFDAIVLYCFEHL